MLKEHYSELPSYLITSSPFVNIVWNVLFLSRGVLKELGNSVDSELVERETGNIVNMLFH